MPKLFRRYLRNKSALMGGLLVLLVLTVTFGARWLAPQDPLHMDMAIQFQPPSSEHLLGTDNFGRDLWARLAHGAKNSLQTALMVVAMSGAIGITLGLISGYYGGWLDSVIMRIADIFLAFPVILLAIALVAALGPSGRNVMLALGLVYWTQYARVVRSSVMAVRREDFVEAAGALGASDFRIITRHILPNVLAPVLVIATLGMGTAIVAESTLSFLGLGEQPPTPTWGQTLAFGMKFLRQAPHMSTYPGLAIMISVLGFNLLGDGLRDLLDPRLKNK
jgi:peptide/nickel transport system permease protein